MATGSLARSGPSRVVRLVRRNHRALMLCGAVVIFATFMVKEALREQLKDLVDSLELARSVYLIRSDSALVSNQLMSVLNEVDDLKLAVKSQNTENDDYSDEIAGDLEFVREQIIQVDAAFENTLQLLERLPDQKTRIERVKKVQVDLYTLAKERTSLDSEIEAERTTNSYATYVMARNLRTKSYDFCVRGYTFGEDAITEAEAFKARKQERYHFYTLASYGLYALGWGLGLLTTLCSVGNTGPQSE